jgi:hypothetical protein
MLLIVSAAIAMVPSAEAPRFRQVARGIEHVMLHAQPPDADPFLGHAFKIDLDVAELRLIPAGGPTSRRTVEEIVAPYAAVVAINASFFDQEGRTMGLAVDKGRLIAGSKRLSWGALVIDDKQARIVLGAEVDASLGYRLVVQGIPRLVVGGKVSQLKPQVAERTAVCADGSRVVLDLDEGRDHRVRTLPCGSAGQRWPRVSGRSQPRRRAVDTTCRKASHADAVGTSRMGCAKRARRRSWWKLAARSGLPVGARDAT